MKGLYDNNKKTMFCIKCGQITHVDKDDVDYPVCPTCNTFSRLEIDPIAEELGAIDIIKKYFDLGCLITSFFNDSDEFGISTVGSYRLSLTKLPDAIFVFTSDETLFYSCTRRLEEESNNSGIYFDHNLKAYCKYNDSNNARNFDDHKREYYKKFLDYYTKLYDIYPAKLTKFSIEKANRLRRDNGLDLEFGKHII